MKSSLRNLLCFIAALSSFYLVSAQQNFTIRYTFNANGTPQIISGSNGVIPATATFGGNKLGSVTYAADGSANSLRAPIIQNNATNYNTNFIQMDLAPQDGFGITITNISVRHRSSEVGNTNLFRIGCNKNGTKPGTNNTNQSTGNVALTSSYTTSNFTPGSPVNTAIGNEYLSAFLTARGNTNTTFNWFIDQVEITGTYTQGATPFPVTFSLDDYKGSRVTKWAWDLKGSGVNTTKAPEYYGGNANMVRFPIFAPSHAENGDIDRTLYENKLADLKNILALRPNTLVYISLKLSGSSTFPDWIASNANGNIFGASVKKPDPEKFSTLLADFVQFMDQENIPIHYFGPGNEVASALDAQRHFLTMRLLRDKLADRGLSNNFKVIGPDAYSHPEVDEWMEDYVSFDPNLEYLDVLGTHYYASRGSDATWEGFKDDFEKPVWYTEAGFGPIRISGETFFPAMSGIRKRCGQIFDAINGGANSITYWQGAGDMDTDIFAYFKVNMIDYIYGFQPVESTFTFTGQNEDHFNQPLFQAFRNGNQVIIFAINPSLQPITNHVISFDKNYTLGSIRKETYVGEATGFAYSSNVQNLTRGSVNTLTTTYPGNSITLYQFELPSSLLQSNAAPVVRANQSFTYSTSQGTNNGTIIGKVLADDNNANELIYSVTGGSGTNAFEIGSYSGLITIRNNNALPNSNTTLTLNVVATDSRGARSAARTVSIDVNGDNSSFVPDPNKTYYIDCPALNVRIGATGNSETAFTTATSTTGANVEWKFVQNSNGYWHLERAAGGNLPMLRSNNSAIADMQSTASRGGWTYFDITPANGDTYFFTLPDGPANYKRLRIDQDRNVTMTTSNLTGSWLRFSITEASSNTSGTSNYRLVKRNATGFAIDGGAGALVDRSIELYTNVNHPNLTWTEINRGGGFYSYQKLNTGLCWDGGAGGANGQDVTLQPCDSSDLNQQWEKIDAGAGHYRLQKRGTNFSMDGGPDGNIDQNVYLWTTNANNANQQWYFEPVNTSAKAIGPNPISDAFSVFPNPFTNTFSVTVSDLSTNANQSNRVSLYSASGQQIFTETIKSGTHTFELKDLDVGLYLMKIESGTELIVKKLIKR